MSAAFFSGISANSSAARGDSTCARRTTPRWTRRNPEPGSRSTCTVATPASCWTCSKGWPGRQSVLAARHSPSKLDRVAAAFRPHHDRMRRAIEQDRRSLGDLALGSRRTGRRSRFRVRECAAAPAPRRAGSSCPARQDRGGGAKPAGNSSAMKLGRQRAGAKPRRRQDRRQKRRRCAARRRYRSRRAHRAGGRSAASRSAPQATSLAIIGS